MTAVGPQNPGRDRKERTWQLQDGPLSLSEPAGHIRHGPRVRPRVSEIVIANRTPARADDLARRIGGRTVDWETAAQTPADVRHGGHRRARRHARPTPRTRASDPVRKAHRPDDRRHAANLRCGREMGAPMQIGFQRRFDAGMARARAMVARGDLDDIYDMVLASRDHDQTAPSSPEAAASSATSTYTTSTSHRGSRIPRSSSCRPHRRSAARVILRSSTTDVTKIIATTELDPGVDLRSAPRRSWTRCPDRGFRFQGFDKCRHHSAPLLALDGPHIGFNADVYTGFIDRFREAYRAETTAFVDLIGGAPNPCPPQAALEALRASIACERSALTGERVEVRTVNSE